MESQACVSHLQGVGAEPTDKTQEAAGPGET